MGAMGAMVTTLSWGRPNRQPPPYTDSLTSVWLTRIISCAEASSSGKNLCFSFVGIHGSPPLHSCTLLVLADFTGGAKSQSVSSADFSWCMRCQNACLSPSRRARGKHSQMPTLFKDISSLYSPSLSLHTLCWSFFFPLLSNAPHPTLPVHHPYVQSANWSVAEKIVT